MEPKKIQIRQGNLWQAPRVRSNNISQIISKDNNGLSVTLFPCDDLNKFEHQLGQLIKSESQLSAIRYHFDSFATIALSILIAGFLATVLGVIGTYEELFKEFILHGLEGYEEFIFVLTAFLIVMAVGFVPKIITSAEGESQIKEFVQNWYNKDQRVKRRFNYALKKLCKNTKNQIELWNPIASDDHGWLWSSFISEAFKLDLNLVLYIKSDELTLSINKLNIATNNSESVPKESTNPEFLNHFINFNDQAGININTGNTLNYLSQAEISVMEMFALLSTSNIPKEWENLKERENDKERKEWKKWKKLINQVARFISLDLISHVLSKYSNYTTDPNQSFDAKHIYILFRRCRYDYGLIESSIDGGNKFWRLKSGITDILPVKDLRQKYKYIPNYIEISIKDLMANVSDPVGLWVVYMILLEINSPLNIKSILLADIIKKIRKSESYFLAAFFYIIDQIDQSKLEDFGSIQSLPLVSLEKLIPILERSGEFEIALRLSKNLHDTNPLKFELISARLHDRLGNSTESINLLKKILSDLYAVNANNDLLIEFRFKLSLLSAWVVVSSGDKSEIVFGKKSLEQSKDIFNEMNSKGVGIDPILLWHYKNNYASYYEWDGDLDSALNFYQQCLSIPGVELKWISGTYVNMGIILRELFLRSPSRNIILLDEAIASSKKGLSLKEEIGDRDELPIAHHNLAISYLHYYKNSNESHFLEMAYDNAFKGLELIKSTESTKRKGNLLAELFVSAALSNLSTSLEDYKNELIEWLNSSPEFSESESVKLFLETFGFNNFPGALITST